jgi:hypothetical protein
LSRAEVNPAPSYPASAAQPTLRYAGSRVPQIRVGTSAWLVRQ